MPTKIIISIHYGHNSTVALSINGKIAACVSEERFCRIKNATGFPIQAYQFVVEQFLGGETGAVDRVVFPDLLLDGYKYLKTNGMDPKAYIDYYATTYEGLIPDMITEECVLPANIPEMMNHDFVVNDVKAHLSEILRVQPEKIFFLEHHLAHAYACLFFMRNTSTHLIFSMDAEGDGISSAVHKWDGKSLKRLSSSSKYHSLGYLYSEITAYLGMKISEHEFKVMGMAPYGDPERAKRVLEKLREIIYLNGNGQIEAKYSMLHLKGYLIRNLTYERFDTICLAIQTLTEELTKAWVEYWVKMTKIKSIGLCGGVFMNVKAVKYISESPVINDIFVMPSSGDESLPLGGCYWASKNEGCAIDLISDLYLGREATDLSIQETIDSHFVRENFEIQEFNDDDLATQIGKLLAEDKIVARCCGREEWGARALGNRSIICSPAKFENVEVLNKLIKNRDFWMPFTPSIMEKYKIEYFNNPNNIAAHYMCMTFDTTESGRNLLKAAVHPRDFTTRPQIVSKEWNPAYYRIIESFQKISGIGAVLNTSFNLHGEPNVSTPSDAIKTVMCSGLEYLNLGRFLLKKKAEVVR